MRTERGEHIVFGLNGGKVSPSVKHRGALHSNAKLMPSIFETSLYNALTLLIISFLYLNILQELLITS